MLGVLPALDRSGAAPIYLQLKEWMRKQIVSGAWPAGAKLTAEADLAQELDLARGTVRKSIEDLIADGLLIRTHGRGTFVAPHPVDQPLAERLVTYSEVLMAQGIAFTTEVLEASVLHGPPPPVAAQLACSEYEPTFFLRRVRRVDGEPVILLHNYVLIRHCPGIEQIDFTARRLFEALEENYALKLERGHRLFQALDANEETAALLEIEEGAAVMYMSQVTYLSDSQPIEYSDIWLRGSSFRLSAALQRDAGAGMRIMVLTNRAGSGDT